ncbi:hypothetical protein K503DRAFT_767938, partial [Rhizopogon vinicolor AM-OR11-026]
MVHFERKALVPTHSSHQVYLDVVRGMLSFLRLTLRHPRVTSDVCLGLLLSFCITVWSHPSAFMWTEDLIKASDQAVLSSPSIHDHCIIDIDGDLQTCYRRPPY